MDMIASVGGWLAGLASLVWEQLPRLLYSLILLLIAFVCFIEFKKVWFDQSVALAPFKYTKNGAADQAAGLNFAQVVESEFRILTDMWTGGRHAGDEDRILTVEQALREEDILAPGTFKSAFSEVKFEAQGINLTAILEALRRWIRKPNQINGSVTNDGSVYMVYADWPQAPARHGGGNEPMIWKLLPMESESEAASELACRIFWVQAASANEKFKLTDGDGFCAYSGAWRSYQIYLGGLKAGRTKDELKAHLATARTRIEQLVLQRSSFPYAYKLYAYLRLLEKDLQDFSEGELQSIEEDLTTYLTMLERLGASDPSVEAKRAAIHTQRVGVQVAAAGDVPLGGSIGPAVGNLTASVCCFVADDQDRPYLITADYVLARQNPGAAVLHPASLDGGKDPDNVVAYLTQILPMDEAARSKGGIALAAVVSSVTAKNNLADVGMVSAVAPLPPVGTEVRMVGRTTSMAKGTVTDTSDGFVRTTRLSAPGDGGAPVVDAQNRLIGLVYASDVAGELTTVLPLKPLFEKHKLSLLK